MTESSHQIGQLNELGIHAELKRWLARPGDCFEVPVDGYIVDVVRGELLIEVQTGGFAAIKRKLLDLLDRHPVRLVHPIVLEKWLVQLPRPDRGQRRRKSPKRGCIEMLFDELCRIPRLLAEPRLSLEVVLVREEEVCRHDPRRRRRRGWTTVERRLLEVVEHRRFQRPADLAGLLPRDLPEPFTTADLAAALRLGRRLAQRMAFCLRGLGCIEAVGKEGNAVLYARADGPADRGVTILGAEPLS